MNERDLYRQTFSQVRSRRTLRWEDVEHMEHIQKRRRPLRSLAAVAAVLAVVCALSSQGIAANILGLKDLLLWPVAGWGEYGQPLSLSGYMDTPESQALGEWLAFQDSYDPDRTILHSVGNTIDSSLANYCTYLVYTPEMADKLEEIAAKYGLKLHKTIYDTAAHPELVEALGDFMGQAKGEVSYMYEDGTFHVDGWAELRTGGFGAVDFQLQRSVKGTFHDALVHLDVKQFDEWDYTTKKGLPVKLALGPERSLLLVDRKDCFITVLVLDGEAQNAGVGSDRGLTRAHLEELADQLDLGLLSPVSTPQPGPEPTATPPAQERTDATKTYAAVLRNLLLGSVLPDGGYVDGETAYDRFALADVDGDGRQELVLLHTSGITAGERGYVIDFDEGYTGYGTPIYIQMEDFPLFTFYSGGYMTAGASHNQGRAGEVLWPYGLYRHTEGDRYTCIATVDAWDSDSWPNEYGPDSEAGQVHRRSGGPVYFVEYTYASGLPDEERSLVLDRAGYNAWWQSLAPGEELTPDYLPLTGENIAAMEQGLVGTVWTVEPAPTQTITADSLASADLPTDVDQGVTVLGQYDLPVTVEGGRTLTLRIRCRAVASGYGTWDYGVQSMDVLERGRLLQTLNISDAQLAGAEGDTSLLIGDGWTQGWESDYLPEILDLNFDGAQDIRLLDFRGVVNGSYLHWLWNAQAGQFEYAFTLTGYDFEVDEQTKQLRTTARGSFSSHTTECYAYDAQGKLQLVDTYTVSPDD